MDIDEMDRKILQELEKYPRASNKKISGRVGLTPQAVGIRIKKMREAGFIGGIKILKPFLTRIDAFKEIKRIKTGITGFDECIGGGFPHPATILLVGESGAGTTLFGLGMLWQALRENLKCAYFSMERPIEHVVQQMQNFGWDMSRHENFQLVDVYSIIKRHIGESPLLGNIDILNIYQEIIEQQKALMQSMNILFFDNFTELIKLPKGPPMESSLVDQLGVNIIKYKRDLSSFYVLKPPIISPNILLILKSYADGVLQFQKRIVNQQIHYALLVEKLILSDHPPTEINFQITKEGIILEDQLLHHEALQHQPSGQNFAFFNIPELDYLTQGLPFRSAWILEVDNIFPLSDLLKFYVNFFMDGIAHDKVCYFIPPKVSFNLLIDVFTKAFQANKLLRKRNISFEDQLLQRQMVIYDYFNQVLMLEDETKKNLFEPFSWSSDPQKNQELLLGTLLKQKDEHSYYGVDVSNLLDLNLSDDQIEAITKITLTILQKRGDITIATLNPSMHSPAFVNKMEYYADGIIRLWVKAQEEYAPQKCLQIVKTPSGNSSAVYQVRVNDIPPYIQII